MLSPWATPRAAETDHGPPRERLARVAAGDGLGRQIYLLNQLDSSAAGRRPDPGHHGRLTVRHRMAQTRTAPRRTRPALPPGLARGRFVEAPECRGVGQDVGRHRRQRTAPRFRRPALRHDVLVLAADPPRNGVGRSAGENTGVARPRRHRPTRCRPANPANVSASRHTHGGELHGDCIGVGIGRPGTDHPSGHRSRPLPPGSPPPSLRAELATTAINRSSASSAGSTRARASTSRRRDVAPRGRVLDSSTGRRRRQGHRCHRLRRSTPVGRRRGAGDRVRFVGRRDDIPEIMRALDVLVVAAVAEPFGLTASKRRHPARRDRHRCRRSSRVRGARGERSPRATARRRASGAGDRRRATEPCGTESSTSRTSGRPCTRSRGPVRRVESHVPRRLSAIGELRMTRPIVATPLSPRTSFARSCSGTTGADTSRATSRTSCCSPRARRQHLPDGLIGAIEASGRSTSRSRCRRRSPRLRRSPTCRCSRTDNSPPSTNVRPGGCTADRADLRRAGRDQRAHQGLASRRRSALEPAVLKILDAKPLIGWFAETVPCDVVYLTRHPIPQSMSCLRNGWTLTAAAYLRDERFVEDNLSDIASPARTT